jgi:very-short-patch-repair endonuclease
LRALGVSRAAIDHWVQRGRLHGLYRGVYAVGHTALRVEGRRLAAVLACGPGAVLSHVSAAAHWGLLQTAAAKIDVTAPTSRRAQRAIRVHRARSLVACDTTTHQAIPVTTIARTLLDLAAATDEHRLERAIAQAHHLRLYDHTHITGLLRRANGHRGANALASATAREDPKHTANDFEARFLKLIRDAGLPEPLVNHPLHAPDHGQIRVDFYWPAHNLVVETDGWHTHATRPAFEQDRAKDAALTAAGLRVVRFTWRTDDATIRRRLERLLR